MNKKFSQRLIIGLNKSQLKILSDYELRILRIKHYLIVNKKRYFEIIKNDR